MRTYILTLALLVVLHAVGNATDKTSPRPNIVLVMCDDLGWGDVGFNGGTVIHTPHLDEMASQSLKFNRFYAQSPVCSPTRGSCLTGRHPYRYGIYFANSGHMKPEERTLAELLQQAGYTTGHFGKWHLGTLTKTIRDANRGGQVKHIGHFSPPQDNGFDVCFSTESKVPTYDPMIRPQETSGPAWDAIQDKTNAVRYGTHYWDESGAIVTENLEGDNSRIIMDRVVPFLEHAAQRSQPFFAVIWFHTPHLPVVAGPKYQALYRQHTDVHTRNYYGCVSAMDEQIGRLRTTLRNLGVADNTLVCFCSDNGPEGDATSPGSAGPFRGRKRSLYEGGIRVPSLVEWPGQVPAGKATEFPAVTSDYLPTILDILDQMPADGRPIDGVSLLPVFDGSLSQRPQPIGFRSRNLVAFSDNRYKLCGNLTKDTWELYDLIEDPWETTDLTAARPHVLSSMVQSFRRWQASCEASDQGDDYRNTAE